MDWLIIKQQAEKFLVGDQEFLSFIEEKKYKVIKVEDSRIRLQRESGTRESLTRSTITRSIKKLQLFGSVNKGELIKKVALESALISFHPQIYWDSKSKKVKWRSSDNLGTKTFTDYIEEALDSELVEMEKLIKIRKRNTMFRKNILKLYDHKCAISNEGPDIVLEACHILEHSICGVNKSENGLLLRADLHDLFDNNYLVIHPEKLTIHLHPSLKKSNYSLLEGKTLNSRIDKQRPSMESLQKKWDKAKWLN